MKHDGEGSAGTNALDTILNYWDTRRKIARVVKYHVNGEVMSTQGCFTKVFGDSPSLFPACLGIVPSEDVVYPCTFTILIDLREGKIRIEEDRYLMRLFPDEPENCGFGRDISTRVFDGAATKVLTERFKKDGALDQGAVSQEVQTDLLLQTADLAIRTFILSQELPILLAHGYIPIESNISVASLHEIDLRRKLQPVGQGSIGGRTCLILRTVPAKSRASGCREYWVDLAREGAILRAELLGKDHLVASVDIDYEETPSGWLPKSWICYEYLRDTKNSVTQSFSYSVQQRTWDPEIRDRDFDITLTPGQLVHHEQSSPGQH